MRAVASASPLVSAFCRIERERLALHADLTARHRHSMCVRLAAHIHHPGAALLVNVSQFHETLTVLAYLRSVGRLSPRAEVRKRARSRNAGHP